jgi:hypothetical protein
VDRREKSRANREQLRCCNWIRLPKANPRKHSGVKAGRRCVRRVPDGKPGARIFDRSTSFASVTLDPVLNDLGSVIAANRFRNPSVRLGSRKNFFAKRRMRAGQCALRGSGGQTSPTLELEETCYAKSPIMFCFSRFDERGIVSPRPGRV